MFIFIDPLGYSGYPIRILKKLLSYIRAELFINYMIYDVIRFCEQEQFEQRLVEQFGNEDFKKVNEVSNPEIKQSFLLNLYCKSLGEIAFSDYTMPFRVNTPNQSTRPRYYLIHASKNLKALKVMKDRMSKVSHLDYRFEAIGIKTQQMSLFDDPEKTSLNDKIKEFCKVNALDSLEYSKIEDWAYANTNGVSKTIKESLIYLEYEGIIEIERKKRQRKDTVTSGALIRFIGEKYKNE